MFDLVYSILSQNGIPENTAWIFAVLSGLVITLIICAFARNVTERILHFIATRFIQNNAFDWDNHLDNAGVLKVLSWLIPLLIFRTLIPFSFDENWPTGTTILVEQAVRIALIIVIIVALNRTVNAMRDYVKTLPFSKELPTAAFAQLFKIVLLVAAIILIYAVTVGESITVALAGFGAVAAVLSFIYQDALRGLVAGVQLTWNNLLAVGDWIEMPSYSVSGTVTEVGLTTVKVQNFDYSMTAVPTNALISSALKNWRGMQEAAGRRMIRSLLIDTNSIRFADEEMLTRLKTLTLIEPYISGKEAAIDASNSRLGVDTSNIANGRQQTNIGIFRQYFLAYLRRHPKILNDMTLVVRQLEPTQHGMPIQLYAFCSEKSMLEFENVQADIFDHIISVLPQFELKVFQHPVGSDFQDGVSAEIPAESA